MELNTLQDLYVDELRDLLSAENQILKALPKMAKAASSPQLARAFQEHLNQSQEHVARLTRIFEMMGEKPRAKKCKGMEGIIEEGKDLVDEAETDEARDAAMISAAQKVEHYEMASYGAVRTYAKHLGQNEAAELLQRTLDEEGETDKKLTQLAESGINVQAQHAEANA
ncbi:MAG TPA: ferritin-like domain-containing protein [Tepidisphaeraceae bacterium]|jgi:ferritin-like metal-binding protein YciE